MTEIKLILLGDSRVGKTSLTQRFLTGNFPDELPGTLGVKLDHYYCRHEQKKKNVKLALWDTAGFERFANCIPQNHYSNTDVALVVFDMSEERTLFSANIWKAELFNHLPTNVPTLLVGNKCDLPEARIHRTRRSAREVAKTFNGFIETSAKDNIMVEEVFEQAITLALNHNDCKPSEETITVNQPQQKKWCSSCTVF